MYDIITTVLLCNTGRDLSCLNKNLNMYPQAKVIFVCEKRGESKTYTMFCFESFMVFIWSMFFML